MDSNEFCGVVTLTLKIILVSFLRLSCSFVAVNSVLSRDSLKMNSFQVAVICNHVSLFIMIHFMITASLSVSFGSFWYPCVAIMKIQRDSQSGPNLRLISRLKGWPWLKFIKDVVIISDLDFAKKAKISNRFNFSGKMPIYYKY